MSKKKRDAYYFPHEYNAKDDPKCERLLWTMGQEGYGIFWTLLEVLRAQPDYTYPVENLRIIASKYNADLDKMRKVVFDFDLFTIVDDKIFFSRGLIERMQPMDEKRKKQSAGGVKGNEKRWGNLATESDTESVTDRSPNRSPNRNKIREDKIRKDKSKENNLSLTPSCEVVSECGVAERERFFEIFFFMNFQNPLSEVDRFINHYSANGWCRNNSTTPVKDRMALARSWSQANKDAPPRFPPEFLSHWQEVYAEAKKRNADSARIMLTDLEAVEIAPQSIRLCCSNTLCQFIERNTKFFKPRLLDRFYPKRNLFYTVK